MKTPRARKKPKARKPRDSGAALILVLWGAVVMSIIAAAAARQASTSAIVVNTAADLTRAKALAEGGLRAGWSGFADGRINAFGAVWGCRVGEDLLLVRIRPESARVDLNAASPELLTALFEAGGAPLAVAEQLSAAAVAYRVFGDNSEDFSSEDGSAPDAAAPGVFRPGAFQAVEELGYLPGMSADLFRAIADDITINGRTSVVDARDASPLVRRALALEAQRSGIAARDNNAQTPDNTDVAGSLMNVRAVAVMRNGAVSVRDAVIEGSFDGDMAPNILVSTQGWLKASESLPDGAAATDCGAGFTVLTKAP